MKTKRTVAKKKSPVKKVKTVAKKKSVKNVLVETHDVSQNAQDESKLIFKELPDEARKHAISLYICALAYLSRQQPGEVLEIPMEELDNIYMMGDTIGTSGRYDEHGKMILRIKAFEGQLMPMENETVN